jgi:hypothetical protein
METSKISDFYAALKVVLNNIGKACLFFIAACAGYFSCEIYHLTRSSGEGSSIRTIKETSIALNERGELLLIDRKSGDFTIYQDSVGLSIFHHYAKDIQEDYKKQK